MPSRRAPRRRGPPGRRLSRLPRLAPSQCLRFTSSADRSRFARRTARRRRSTGRRPGCRSRQRSGSSLRSVSRSPSRRAPWAGLVSSGCMSASPEPKKILVAVAWPYASGPRHIGHVAGFGVPSDTFARYHRLKGNDVLMVSGTDEHGTPVMVAADDAGESPRETADRFNAVIRDDLRNLGLSYDLFTRTTTRNHYRVVQDIFRTLYEKGYVIEETTLGAFSATTGHTLPDRYIEGTCPHCGYTGARGDQCDNCGRQLDPVDLIDPRSQHRRDDARVPRDEAPVPRSAGVQGRARRLDREAGALAPERAPVLAQLRQGAEAARDHARPRLGRADPGAGLRGADRQADLRLVRRGDRLPLRGGRVGGEYRRPRRLALVVAEPGLRALLLHGEGQHRLPHRDLAEHPARLRRGRRARRRPRQAPAAVQHRLERVPHPGGEEVRLQPRDRDPRARLPQPLRRRRAALLPVDRRPGDTGHRLHVGRVRAPQQRRARRDLGQPRQPHAHQRAPQLRRRPGARRAHSRGRGASRRGRGRLRDRRRPDRGGPLQGRAHRGDAARGAREPVHERAGAVGADQDRPRARRDRALRRAPRRRQPQGAVDAVPALQLADAARAARLRRLLAGPLEFREVEEEGGERHVVLTGDYSGWVGRWEPSALAPGQALREPRPLFKKLDPEQVVADELARMEAAARA